MVHSALNWVRISERFVASLPTTHGERMTLRLLAVETEQLSIHRLGLSPSHEDTFCEAMSHRQGLLLVTGPTGSGKSTTLYAALRYLLAHHPGKIITIEDPVEFGWRVRQSIDSPLAAAPDLVLQGDRTPRRVNQFRTTGPSGMR